MELNDKALLLLLDSEPEQGMALLREHYTEHLRATAAQRLDNPDDVQECVCDTLADFYLQRAQFDADKGSLRGYLISIAQRKAIRRYWENRKQQLAVRLSETDSADLGGWEQAEQLRQALDRLSEKDSSLLKLKYYDGYTATEIARMMGLEYETVKKRLQRALKKLQKLMEEE